MYPLPHFDLSDVFKEKLSIDSSDSAPFHLFGFLTIFRTNSFLKVWILTQFTDTVRGRNSYIRLCNATKTFTYSMSLNSNFLFFFQKCFSGAYQWNEKKCQNSVFIENPAVVNKIFNFHCPVLVSLTNSRLTISLSASFLLSVEDRQKWLLNLLRVS